ncbi:glycine cleavage system aminomethyltransferase GcvT [Candidatus Margulisiibacteriota bacterium]
MQTMIALKHTPLFNNHVKHGAKMVPFGEWEMPLQFESILGEHKYCREQVALFDVCHMGEFYFKGNLKKSGIEQAFPFSLHKIKEGTCKYGVVLNEQGGIVDDLIVYRLAVDEVLIVVNAGNIKKDFKHIQQVLKGEYTFVDISEKTAKLDVQGPLSTEVLKEHFGDEINAIPYFGFKHLQIHGEEVLVSRTGYTGERGYELYLPYKKVTEVWDFLLQDKRIKPAGLGARDILRIEVGYNLYGHDIDETITPHEANLDFCIEYDKDFIGKEAVVKQKNSGVLKKRIGIKTNTRRAPREKNRIQIKGKEVGHITSGCYSPVMGCGIGIGYIETQFAKQGNTISIGNGSIQIEAIIADPQFFKNKSIRT